MMEPTIPAVLPPLAGELGSPAGADVEAIALLIGYALRRAHMVVMDDFHQTITAGGIRALHYAVMTVIARDPGVRSSQLSQELKIKHTNLVPLLDELQSRGLVERRSVPQDRRARGLYMTEPGHTLMSFLLPRVAEHERRFSGRLGTDGKFALIGLLNRISGPDSDPLA
jgi:DNA-binding MarR family transcriptional regulator